MERVKSLRKQNAFLLIKPHLEKEGLPVKDLDNLLDPINIEYALLCLDEEIFNNVFDPELTVIGNKVITKDEGINELENLITAGVDTNNLLEALEKQFGFNKKGDSQ